MKLNKLVIGAVAIVAAVLIWSNRSVKADQHQPVQHDVILLYIQGGGQYGISGDLHSFSKGVNVSTNFDNPAEVIADALSQGYSMKSDGLLFVLTR